MKSRREILLHPVRMQILQYLSKNGGATPGELSEALPEVPRTTLYRHVNLLHSEGYLRVTKEVKIRGTYEREYEVNPEVMRGKTAKEKERQDVFNMLLKMLGDFEDYYERPDNDSEKDMLFFTGNTLRLSDKEFSQFLQELFTLIAKYDVISESAGQKTRSITMISAPVVNVPEKVQVKKKAEPEAEPVVEEPVITTQEVVPEVQEEEKSEEVQEESVVEPEKPVEEKEQPSVPEEQPAVQVKKPDVFQKQPDNGPLRQVVQMNKSQEGELIRRSSGNRMTFRQAMEKISGAFKITDTASRGGVFEMSADATYDMADKVKSRES